MSDHCVAGVVRDANMPRSKPRMILTWNIKHSGEQTFLWDLFIFGTSVSPCQLLFMLFSRMGCTENVI